MLKIEHITAGYEGKEILHDVSLSVNEGDILLLTGGNGSGKSTLLKCIYGIIKPYQESSRIIFEGTDIIGEPTYSMLKNGISYMPQKNNVFETLSVMENLKVATHLYKNTESQKRIEEVLEKVSGLRAKSNRKPFDMSGGERQLLAFAMVLVHFPKIALLDEPFAGVDAKNASVMKELIAKMNQQGATFVIIEHKQILINDLVNRVIEMKMGKINKIS